VYFLGAITVVKDYIFAATRRYIPFPKSGDALLFHLISKLYEQTSVIITTNLALPLHNLTDDYLRL
jgi:hypothetical protein